MLEAVLALAAVAAGALIQGSIGFGYAFVAVPMMALLYPEALPASSALASDDTPDRSRVALLDVTGFF